MTKLKFTRAALSDLDDIWDYTEQKWGTAQAETYLTGINQICDGIADGTASPRQFSATHKNTAFCRFEHHYIFFTASRQAITIIAILHERMDLIARVKDRL